MHRRADHSPQKSRLRENYSGLILLDDAPAEEIVGRVAESLYHLAPVDGTTEGSVSLSRAREWGVVDSLFAEAKSSYEEVVEVLQTRPEVYRLEAVRDRKLANLEHLTPTSMVRPVPHEKDNEDESELQSDELESFLDPFILPANWSVEVDRAGRGACGCWRSGTMPSTCS